MFTRSGAAPQSQNVAAAAGAAGVLVPETGANLAVDEACDARVRVKVECEWHEMSLVRAAPEVRIRGVAAVGSGVLVVGIDMLIYTFVRGSRGKKQKPKKKKGKEEKEEKTMDNTYCTSSVWAKHIISISRVCRAALEGGSLQEVDQRKSKGRLMLRARGITGQRPGRRMGGGRSVRGPPEPTA
ncbi:hypothetical protein B0H14DRAFT_2589347 [Mycena olivaceomarginata]|nr:hypothetical protein B0H14DRAFT_2589347 [Mycena olivaceomarginata]